MLDNITPNDAGKLMPENVVEEYKTSKHGLHLYAATKGLYQTRFIDKIESMIPRHREQEVLAMSGSLQSRRLVRR